MRWHSRITTLIFLSSLAPAGATVDNGQGNDGGALAAAGAPLARAAGGQGGAGALAAAGRVAPAPAACPIMGHAPIVGSMATRKASELHDALTANKQAIDAAQAEQADLVAAARRAGLEWSAICEATGHARMTVNRLAMKANNGKLPRPGDRGPRKRKTA